MPVPENKTPWYAYVCAGLLMLAALVGVLAFMTFVAYLIVHDGSNTLSTHLNQVG